MTPAEQHAAVLAALDRLEQIAREATPGEWRWADPGSRFGRRHKMALLADEQMIVPSGSPDMYPSRHDAEHIVANNPAVVLPQLAGRRRSIVRHAPAWEDSAGIVYCDWCAAGRQVIKPAAWPDRDYRDAAAGLGVLDDLGGSA